MADEQELPPRTSDVYETPGSPEEYVNSAESWMVKAIERLDSIDQASSIETRINEVNMLANIATANATIGGAWRQLIDATDV